MKFKNLKKLATIGALISALTGMSKANTITNSVEETDLFVGTVKDIALANNQLLITSDDAVIKGIPVKLLSSDTNTFSQTIFAAGDTNQLLFTNSVAGLAYDDHSTNAWYSFAGNHKLLGNTDVSKMAISSVSCRNSAEVTSDIFSDFPSPILAAKDGHIWLSFIDPDEEAVCVSKYQVNGNSDLMETAYNFTTSDRQFSKIHTSATDGSNIWCTVTDKDGQDSILYFKGEDLDSEELTQGERNGIKASCGVALLGETVYAVSSDQKKLVQFSKGLSDLGTINLNSKVSAIASDGANVFAISENGNEVYKVFPENSVQTIVLDRPRTDPIKKIIAAKGTIYGATARSVLRARSK